MKIKTFLIIMYGIAGLFIALFTAIMTYLIIDVPIGVTMSSEIGFTILLTLPIIGLFSYFIGNYFSKKFDIINQRLDDIDEDRYSQEEYKDKITDINHIHSSINQLSSRLKNSIKELKSRNENLNNLILSLSHDIKTPLTIIDGYLEEFEDNLISQKDIPKVISILKKETIYLNELSSDVIGYIKSQEIIYSKENLYLKEFIHSEVCSLIRIENTLEMKCLIPENLQILFNPISLKKILVNLLHNATKYTVKGTITLKAKKNMISIEDTGIGIASKYQDSIFEPFYCLDKSKNREKSGFGLGLSIARNLARSNGGELYLDPTYEDGCRFVLLLTEEF